MKEEGWIEIKAYPRLKRPSRENISNMETQSLERFQIPLPSCLQNRGRDGKPRFLSISEDLDLAVTVKRERRAGGVSPLVACLLIACLPGDHKGLGSVPRPV